jgi:hypothetical protein
MESQKIFIRQDGTAAIRCPKCGKEKVFPAIELKGKHKYRVKCTCKAVFGIQLEFREKFRKETNLDGFVEKLSQDEKWDKIIWQSTTTNSHSVNCRIRNISVLGIGLATIGKKHIKAGDQIKVEFILDTPSTPKIIKKAIVRTVNDNYIGCEFLEADKHDQELGFYLL